MRLPLLSLVAALVSFSALAAGCKSDDPVTRGDQDATLVGDDAPDLGGPALPDASEPGDDTNLPGVDASPPDVTRDTRPPSDTSTDVPPWEAPPLPPLQVFCDTFCAEVNRCPSAERDLFGGRPCVEVCARYTNEELLFASGCVGIAHELEATLREVPIGGIQWNACERQALCVPPTDALHPGVETWCATVYDLCGTVPGSDDPHPVSCAHVTSGIAAQMNLRSGYDAAECVRALGACPEDEDVINACWMPVGSPCTDICRSIEPCAGVAGTNYQECYEGCRYLRATVPARVDDLKRCMDERPVCVAKLSCFQ